MNELKILLTDYLKMHNLTRNTFIQKVGYKNSVKGLPVLSVESMDSMEKISIPINDGFTYHKSFNESYQFNRLCKQINGINDSKVSEAAWNYITNEIVVNDDPDVIGY